MYISLISAAFLAPVTADCVAPVPVGIVEWNFQLTPKQGQEELHPEYHRLKARASKNQRRLLEWSSITETLASLEKMSPESARSLIVRERQQTAMESAVGYHGFSMAVKIVNNKEPSRNCLAKILPKAYQYGDPEAERLQRAENAAITQERNAIHRASKARLMPFPIRLPSLSEVYFAPDLKTAASFEQNLEEMIRAGVRIFSFSIGIPERDIHILWPTIEDFVAKHPDILFVTAAGEGRREIEQVLEFPQLLRHRPNVITVGLSSRTSRGRFLALPSGRSGGVEVYCDEAVCATTSEATAKTSRLLSLIQRKLQLERGAVPPGQDILREFHRLAKKVEMTDHQSRKDTDQSVPYTGMQITCDMERHLF